MSYLQFIGFCIGTFIVLTLLLAGLGAVARRIRGNDVRHNPEEYSTEALVFVGRDHSMGLRHGTIYSVTIERNPRQYAVMIVNPIRCPYSSWSAFWDNWEHPPDARHVR